MSTLFISDYGSKTILSFDASTWVQAASATPGDGKYARGMRAYGSTLWVVTNGSVIQRYDTDLNLDDSEASPGISGTLYDVAVDDDYLWICDDTDGTSLVNFFPIALDSLASDIGGYNLALNSTHLFVNFLILDGSPKYVTRYSKDDPQTALETYITGDAAQVKGVFADDDYVYIVTQGNLYKVDASDMTLVDSLTVAEMFTDASLLIQDVTSDGTNLYVGASPSEGTTSYIAIVTIGDMSVTAEKTISGVQQIACLAFDGTAPPAPPPTGPKIHLDRRIKVTGTWDDVDTTSFGTIPYVDGETDAVFWLINAETKTPIEYSIVASEILVSDPFGSFDGVEAYWGKDYEMRFRFSEWNIKNDQKVANLQGRLQTRGIALNYLDTGYYTIEYTPKGRAKRIRPFRGWPAPDVGQRPNVRTGIDRVFIMAGAEGLTVDIVNNTYLPSKFALAAWEGWYTARNRVL